MPLFLFLLTVISRLPFTSKYLYHMDSGHFALALQNYDLVLHQPHPPGYFLYIVLGKLLYPFASDANTTFILISIVFSGLTVAAIYQLGKELFDAKIGTIAALLAMTSPIFWFHGEVALSYTVEAFFSVFIGLLCWKMYQGKSEYLWPSISILALAGGFRQSSVLFLFPLWIFSARKESLHRIIAGLALGAAVMLSWLIPMVIMTGGPEKYIGAFEELWLFSTGHNSVYERGLPQFLFFLRILCTFIFFSLGAALPFLLLAGYILVRSRKTALLKSTKSSFLAIWILPSILFHLLIFIHPANPGYVLILLPPLLIVSSLALRFLNSEISTIVGKGFHRLTILFVLLINTSAFLFYPLLASREEIKNHDQGISAIIKGLSTFKPNTTVLFIGPYSFYSYRHLMLYLPQFTVYQVDVRTSPTGQKRKLFGGAHGTSFTTDQIIVSKDIKSFAAVAAVDHKVIPEISSNLSIVKVTNDFVIISGHIEFLTLLYPELKPYIKIVSTEKKGNAEKSPSN